MSTRTAFPALLAMAIAFTAAGATAEEPSLELEVSQTSVRVGDRVRVLASARGGGELLWGELSVALEPGGPWELVDPPTAVPGARPPAWELTLAPMELGEQGLPSIGVSARAADGETTEISSNDPPTVTVVSVLSADEEEAAPAPLRDPIGARGLPWEWVLPIAGLLLPLVAALAWWWRGRGRPAAAVRAVLPPFAELEALAADLSGRVGREPAEGICDRLAAGLRRYLERRTGEPAGEMTSFELRLLARRRGWPESTQRLVQQVMGVADGVRFGRRSSTDDELSRAVDLALDAARTVESFLSPPTEEQNAVGAG